MSIETLKARLGEISDQIGTLAEVEKAGGELSAEQIQEFEALESEFAQVEAKVKRMERAEALEAKTAQKIEVVGSIDKGRELEKGEAVSEMVRAICQGGKDPRRAAEFAENEGFPEIAASLSVGTPGSGGYTVPPGWSSDFIELYRPNTVVRQNARMIHMPNGTFEQAKRTSSSQAGYIAELDNAPVTEPGFGNLTMSAKKLAAIVPVSNDLIRRSSRTNNDLIIDDLTTAVAEREDLAGLRGDGTGNTPTGLLNLMDAGNKFAASGATAPTLANVDSDARKLILALENNNVAMRKPMFVTSPRVFGFLQDMRDGNGNKAYPEISSGFFKGIPIVKTTQLPINLGAGTDESEFYLVDWSDFYLGDTLSVTIDVSSEASYNDGSQKNAFQRDETLVRVICEHDFAMRHDFSAAMLNAVRWGG